jgi:alpha-1,6-mannosyltransferase
VSMPGPIETPPLAGPTRVMRAALTVLVLALLGFIALQYLTPPGFRSDWGLNPDGVLRFRAAFGIHAPKLALGTYQRVLQVLLLASWAAYLLFAIGGLMGGRLSRRALLAAIGGLALAFALAWPVSFSVDVYRYVGFARLGAVYHLNPYAAGREELIALRDVTAPFMPHDLPSPYGPLWMLLSTAVIWVVQSASLLVQVVALKLVAAAALIVLARLGEAVADRLHPGRGQLTLAAIGLNPLLLFECPGNGHNDLVMTVFVMAALLALARGRLGWSAALTGCAAAVKFIPLALVPWLVLCAARPVWPHGRRALAATVKICGAALLPLLVAYAPLWRGSATWTGIAQRWALAQTGTASVASAPSLVAAAVFVGATIWVVLRPELPRLVSAWVAVALAVLLTASGICFPWYLAWSWPVLLTRWDKNHVTTSLGVLAFAIFLTLLYTFRGG